jgi:hypothetical protein
MRIQTGLEWENENGLVDGVFPKGVACPFTETCGFAPECRRPKCMDKDFSCGAARFISMVKGMKERKEKKNEQQMG